MNICCFGLPVCSIFLNMRLGLFLMGFLYYHLVYKPSLPKEWKAWRWTQTKKDNKRNIRN